jgi:hypothetical protein
VVIRYEDPRPNAVAWGSLAVNVLRDRCDIRGVLRLLLAAVHVFCALGSAWLLKVRGRISSVSLPDTRCGRCLSEGEVSLVLRLAEWVVRIGTLRTGRKCFFRSFVLGCVLRKHGIPADLNVGLRGLVGSDSRGRVDGHCWLTLCNSPFAERCDPKGDYPHFLGVARNGIRYWLE